MDKKMSPNKWNPYVLMRNEETASFFKDHFTQEGRKPLFILAKGFDVRMNIVISKLIECCPDVDLECLLIEFDEGPNSSSHKYKSLVDENIQELTTLLSNKTLVRRSVALLGGTGKNQKRVGDRNAAGIIHSYDEISKYTDIVVDISALPRGIYFSLIGKILSLVETKESPINLFVSVAENAAIDIKTKEFGADDDLNYLHGFGGRIELSSEIEEPVIWFPILGEGKVEHFRKAYNHIMSQNRPYEICPILPFPAKNPRRVDALIVEYHSLLFDELGIEAKSIMYVPEQNPFEAYIRLNNAIKNYNLSLKPLKGCKAVASTFSSKLLSIGTLLTAYELREEIGVGVLNVDSEGYIIDDIEGVKNLKNQSELFLSWLTGQPYQKPDQKSE
ncbi:MAG TPA: hypothetical protein PK637_02070 [Flavobacteriales bacterium]|nr:hypothetical protein [Flavobacteriales bacterium]HRE95520.1 hypothetical protein [Flavobacteriales bacterium]HRJ38954.1 hypothetical protein [Flavobacteriales bacterium]